MHGSDTRKLGFLIAGILLGVLVNLIALGFGADRTLAFGFSAVAVLGSLAMAWLSPGPIRPPLTELQRRQRARSIAIALVLFVFCAMFYAATIVRLGSQVANRPY